MMMNTLVSTRNRLVRLAIVIVSLGAGHATSALADFSFNPSGTALTGPYSITGLGYAPGNALAKNSLPSGGPLTPGTTFTVYFQTHLTSLVGPNAPAAVPGLNSTFQITLVASLTETVTSVTTVGNMQTATFALATSPTDRISIYENNAVVFNDAAGTGFTAGTVIASLSPSAFLSSNFTANTSSLGAFNTTGAGNNSGSGQAEVGSGSTNLTANVGTYNASYFQPPNGTPQLRSSIVNLQVNSQFDSVSPSLLFTNPLTSATFAPNIGSTNGLSGPDLQLQVGAFVQSFTAVPEPASVAMTLIGFTAVGFGSVVARRRKATV